jgi:Zn-dependent protease/CBS domain-containing protein
MNESLSLGRIAGIRVGLNWSLVVVIALIAWTLATGSFPSQAPGLGPGVYWIAGLVAAVLFLASLLAHELAHSVVAQRLGVRVEGITLWLFGGVSRLSGEANSARAETLITVVGPVTSLVLGGLFLLAGGGLAGAGAPKLVVATVNWVGTINLTLGIFNLLPAFPLDGGRILRALLWARSGDRIRATSIAARVGMGFAFLLIALGILSFLLAGNVIGGLWIVFLGWFLLGAARSEESSGLIRQALDHVTVADVMTPNPVLVPDYITVDDLMKRHLFADRHTTFPTQDFGGNLTGLVTLAGVKKLPADRRGTTRVRDIACPLAQVPTAAPEDSLLTLIGRMGGCAEGRALVLRDGALAGIVSPSDVSRAVQRSSAGRAQPAGT